MSLELRYKPKPQKRATPLKKEDIYPLANDYDDDELYKTVNSATKIKPVEQKRSTFGKLFFNKTSKITGKPTEGTDFDRPVVGGKKAKKHKSRKNRTKRRRCKPFTHFKASS